MTLRSIGNRPARVFESRLGRGRSTGRTCGSGDRRDAGTGTLVRTKTKAKTKKPSLYRVLLLNDDYTPMEFVVYILERVFQKDKARATQIMLHVHNRGVGECGVYTHEIAETKVTQVLQLSKRHEHPLQCVMERQ